ncbi:putative [Hexamita inflata]|uniref:Putative n=1 Tax=Hexamita inflata TaxID=28002 RepID=A0AA86TQX5_9EUKA|nr:putative [Hexamita inflata]
MLLLQFVLQLVDQKKQQNVGIESDTTYVDSSVIAQKFAAKCPEGQLDYGVGCECITGVANYANVSGICRCSSGYLSFDRTQCVAACAPAYINVARTICIVDCKVDSSVIGQDTTLCVLPTQCSPYYLNTDSSQCIASCSTINAVVSLNTPYTCVTCESIDPTKVYNSGACICKDKFDVNGVTCICKPQTYLTGITCSPCPVQIPALIPNLNRRACVQKDQCLSGGDTAYLSLDETQCVASCSLYDVNQQKCVSSCGSAEIIKGAQCQCDSSKGFVLKQGVCVCSGVSPYIFPNKANNLCTPCNEQAGFKPDLNIQLNCECLGTGAFLVQNLARTACLADCSSDNAFCSADLQHCIANCAQESSITTGLTCTACSTVDQNTIYQNNACVCKDGFNPSANGCTQVCDPANNVVLKDRNCACIAGMEFVYKSTTKCWCQVGLISSANGCIPCPSQLVPNNDRTFCVSTQSCSPGYLNYIQTACVPDCALDFQKFSNLAGTQCVYKANCGVGTTQTLNPSKCVCNAKKSFVQLPGGTECTSCAALGKIPNEAGTGCVSCTGVGVIPNPTYTQCICNASDFFVNTSGVCKCMPSYAGTTTCTKCEFDTPIVDEIINKCTACDYTLGFIRDKIAVKDDCRCDPSRGFVINLNDKPNLSCIKCTGNTVPINGVCSPCPVGQINDENNINCICDINMHLVSKNGKCACDVQNNYAGPSTTCVLCTGDTAFVSPAGDICIECNVAFGFNPGKTNGLCTCINPAHVISDSKCGECDGNKGFQLMKVNGACVCKDQWLFDVNPTTCVQNCNPYSIKSADKCVCVDNSSLTATGCVCKDTFIGLNSKCVCKDTFVLVDGLCQCPVNQTEQDGFCKVVVKVNAAVVGSAIGGSIVLIIVICVAVWYTKKAKKEARKKNHQPEDDENDEDTTKEKQPKKRNRKAALQQVNNSSIEVDLLEQQPAVEDYNDSKKLEILDDDTKDSLPVPIDGMTITDI